MHGLPLEPTAGYCVLFRHLLSFFFQCFPFLLLYVLCHHTFGTPTCPSFCVRLFFSFSVESIFPPASPNRNVLFVLTNDLTFFSAPSSPYSWLHLNIATIAICHLCIALKSNLSCKIHHRGERDSAQVAWTAPAQRFACPLHLTHLLLFALSLSAYLFCPSRSRQPRNRSCAPSPFPCVFPIPFPIPFSISPLFPFPSVSTSSSAGTGAKQKPKKSDRQQHALRRYVFRYMPQVHPSLSLFAGKITKVEQVVCGPWVTFQTTEPIAFFLFFSLACLLVY